MHIVIDARMYHLQGGHGRYLQELIAHLEQLDTNHRYTLILHPQGFERYRAGNPRFHAVTTTARWYTLREQLELPRLLRRLRPDLVHFPHWNVPLLYRGPVIITLHDLILRSHPHSAVSTRNPFVFWFKYLAFRAVLSNALRRALHIITVSKTAAADLNSFFPNLLAPITPIELAAHTAKTHKNNAVPPYPYFLYVGTAYPHKNLPFLLRAFHQYSIRFNTEHRLLLAGKIGYFYMRLLQSNTALSLCDHGALLMKDAPSEEELESLYAGATAVVCPAYAEGFGLPALEAAARGIPVLCADIPALREVMDEAALYFPSSPYRADIRTEHTEKLITALEHTARDADFRYMLAQKGRARAALFSWTETARKTHAVYETART